MKLPNMRAAPLWGVLTWTVMAGLPAIAAPLPETALSFAVLGHETVTNAHVPPNPVTQVYGDLGVAPGTSVTGLSAGTNVTGGSIHLNDASAQAALAALTASASTLGGSAVTANLTGTVLGAVGSSPLTPGVYRFDSSAMIDGNLVLDFAGLPNAGFVFQIGTSLTTASGANVQAINGNAGSSIVWLVGSSATLGSDTQFAGNVLAGASISLGPRAQVLCGRVFALTGAVTLIDNLVSSDCDAQNFVATAGVARGDFGSWGFSGLASPVDEPSGLWLASLGLAALAGWQRRAAVRATVVQRSAAAP